MFQQYVAYIARTLSDIQQVCSRKLTRTHKAIGKKTYNYFYLYDRRFNNILRPQPENHQEVNGASKYLKAEILVDNEI